MSLEQTLEQTMFSFDVMLNEQLYSRQETVIPVVRVGKMHGLEICIDDARLDPIHMVFHVMTGRVMLDIVTDKDVMVTHTDGRVFLSNKYVLTIREGDRLRITENITIENCKISFIEGTKGYSGLSKAIEKDVQMTMAQMGITYGSITDLTPEQRITHALVTKLATFAAGTSRTLGQLSNVCQQSLLRSNNAKNTCDVLSEVIRTHEHPDGARNSPWDGKRGYIDHVNHVVRDLAQRAQAGEPSESPVDSVGATILDMQRARLNQKD